MKKWIESKIKRILRKRLYKAAYCYHATVKENLERAEWIYNEPLRNWNDMLWCLDHAEYNNFRTAQWIYKEFIQKNFYKKQKQENG